MARIILHSSPVLKSSGFFHSILKLDSTFCSLWANLPSSSSSSIKCLRPFWKPVSCPTSSVASNKFFRVVAVASVDAHSGSSEGALQPQINSVAPKVAFFDVDGTITKTNVVLAYFTHRITELSFLVKLIWLPWFALTCIFYLIVDSINRALFNRIFYLIYKGRHAHTKTEMAEFIYRNYYRPRVFMGAVELIQKLKQDGYRIVFVTGCLDFLIAPLADELGADYVYAAELVEENGRFTGKLKGMAASNAEKADRVIEYAKTHRISLSDCLAFGDSIADIPMLEVVGHPHVVNPDARLKAVAEKRGWPIIRWMLEQKPVLEFSV